MRIRCEQCGEDGYLQQLTKNYFRVRHYKGINSATRKSEFFFHQQSKAYIETLLSQLKSNRKPD